MNKLDTKAMALACGSSWAILVLLIGWSGAIGWGRELSELLSKLYIGYGPSFIGGLIGMLWGFIDGALGGFIIAVIYNRFAKK